MNIRKRNAPSHLIPANTTHVIGYNSKRLRYVRCAVGGSWAYYYGWGKSTRRQVWKANTAEELCQQFLDAGYTEFEFLTPDESKQWSAYGLMRKKAYSPKP